MVAAAVSIPFCLHANRTQPTQPRKPQSELTPGTSPTDPFFSSRLNSRAVAGRAPIHEKMWRQRGMRKTLSAAME
jgi:hypothetical protein